MIRGEKINFSYRKGKKFIEDLDIDIQKGKITTILGPNGSGKSTLLSVLACSNKSQGGAVYIGNTKINTLSYKEIAKRIATVHQQNTAPEDIDVETLISYGRSPYKKNIDEDRKLIEFAISATNLEKIRYEKVMSLSGGQRQRAFIAMALAQNTEVLLLDEPTTYLDIYHQIEILEVVKELNEQHNITIIMVLHDINQAIKYSHNIVIMKNGKIIDAGLANSVINEHVIKDVYNVEGFIGRKNNEMYFIPIKMC